ncbi:hypothetical protein LX36DRAFT_136396 [Colletotrichum falcatum]|nr:hypothetical protein LX36DRAFT_136396 [Colletotrichum falcatum]
MPCFFARRLAPKLDTRTHTHTHAHKAFPLRNPHPMAACRLASCVASTFFLLSRLAHPSSLQRGVYPWTWIPIPSQGGWGGPNRQRTPSPSVSTREKHVTGGEGGRGVVVWPCHVLDRQAPPPPSG